MTAQPPTPRKRPTRASALRDAFTTRLGLKATALLISVLLWMIVSARQPVQGYVRVAVEPVLDSTLVLLDPPASLEALVAGRAVDIAKLHAYPPAVHRTIDGDAPDTLVLDVTPGDVRLPPELTNAVQILDLQPRSVTLRFGTRASRRVPVVSGGRIMIGGDTTVRAADHIEFEPAMVRITGPRRTVRRIASVRPLRLTVAPGDTLRHVADLDTVGLGVRVLPPQVKVHVRPERP
ncbi:MAG: hypothetical protein ABJA80_13275 [bacterium]